MIKTAIVPDNAILEFLAMAQCRKSSQQMAFARAFKGYSFTGFWAMIVTLGLASRQVEWIQEWFESNDFR